MKETYIMNSSFRFFSTLIATAFFLAGCAVGPAYERAEIDSPMVFKEATLSPEAAKQWQAAQPKDAISRGQWWRIFNDPELDRLQQRAAAANQELRAAAARVKQARALRRDALADRYPTIDGGFGPRRQRIPGAAQGLGDDAPATTYTAWRAELGASYEVDLFRRVASEADAASAEAQQSAALFESVLLALQADVAQNYFTLRQLDAEQELYQRTVELRRETLALVEQRYRAGDIGELDVARSRSALASAQAEALGVERQRALTEHALATLLGTTPAGLSLPVKPLTRLPVDIPAGLPSSLLERRPDIAAAERAMAAANARIGAARAAFFPRLTLTGSMGYESAQLGDLLQWSSRAFLLGPLVGTALSLPIFDGGRREAGLERARAEYEEDVANYRQTVLRAFKEVEDGLASLRILGEQTEVQDAAVQQASRAAQLSQIQYREGSISYLEVIDADREVLRQRRASVQLDGERALAAVALVRAIGGGWDTGSAEGIMAQGAGFGYF